MQMLKEFMFNYLINLDVIDYYFSIILIIKYLLLILMNFANDCDFLVCYDKIDKL